MHRRLAAPHGRSRVSCWPGQVAAPGQYHPVTAGRTGRSRSVEAHAKSNTLSRRCSGHTRHCLSNGSYRSESPPKPLRANDSDQPRTDCGRAIASRRSRRRPAFYLGSRIRLSGCRRCSAGQWSRDEHGYSWLSAAFPKVQNSVRRTWKNSELNEVSVQTWCGRGFVTR